MKRKKEGADQFDEERRTPPQPGGTQSPSTRQQVGNWLTDSQVLVPPGSQSDDFMTAEVEVTSEDVRIVQQVVSDAAALFEPILQGLMASIGPTFVGDGDGDITMDEATVNTVLGQATGFEPVPIRIVESPGTDAERGEHVLGTPGLEQEDVHQSVPELDTAVDEDAATDENEESLYIAAAAEEIVGDALEELLGAVIGEISAEDSGSTPQELRWLVLDDPEFTALLGTARRGAVDGLKDVISSLLEQDEAVQQ